MHRKWRQAVATAIAAVGVLGAAGADDPTKLAVDLVQAHNRERAAAKKPPLKSSPQLAAVARAHARDMADHEVMSHEGSDKSEPADRVRRQRYAFQRVGENVAYGQKTIDEVMKAWMNSPHHRDNILGDFTEVGVGRVESKSGEPYWCAVFATPWPVIDPRDAANELRAAINAMRSEAGKPPLEVDTRLAELAREHAKEMAAAGKLDAKGDDGLNPFERAEKRGIRYRELGLRDAAGYADGEGVVKAWAETDDGKENLLAPFRRVGIGYAIDKDGKPYWSVLFGKPND